MGRRQFLKGNRTCRSYGVRTHAITVALNALILGVEYASVDNTNLKNLNIRDSTLDGVGVVQPDSHLDLIFATLIQFP